MRPEKKKKKTPKAKGGANEQEQRQEPEQDSTFNKRNVVSNWTKYEMPSSSDDEDVGSGLTGQEFTAALESASGADSLLRLKGEREWDDGSDKDGANEFFSLDLKALESAVEAIPVQEALRLRLLNERLRGEYVKSAEEKLQQWMQKYNDVDQAHENEGISAAEAELSKKVINILAVDDGNNQNNNEEVQELEDWLDDYLQ